MFNTSVSIKQFNEIYSLKQTSLIYSGSASVGSYIYIRNNEDKRVVIGVVRSVMPDHNLPNGYHLVSFVVIGKEKSYA